MARLHAEHLVSIVMLQDMNREMDSFSQARSSLLQVFGDKVTDASQRILKTFLDHISKDSSETAPSVVPSLTPEKFAAWLLETLRPEELTDEFRSQTFTPDNQLLPRVAFKRVQDHRYSWRCPVCLKKLHFSLEPSGNPHQVNCLRHLRKQGTAKHNQSKKNKTPSTSDTSSVSSPNAKRTKPNSPATAATTSSPSTDSAAGSSSCF